MRAKEAEKNSDMFTPKGKGVMNCKNNNKRKRVVDDEKENVPPGGVKIPRKLISASPSRVLANPVKLNKDQTAVLSTVKSGRSIFFTGSAGTGKSFLLRRVIGKYGMYDAMDTHSS